MGSNNPTNQGFSHCSHEILTCASPWSSRRAATWKTLQQNDACTPNEAKFSLSWMGLHGYTHINQHDNGRKPSMKMYVLLKNHHFPASHASGAGKAHPLLSEEKIVGKSPWVYHHPTWQVHLLKQLASHHGLFLFQVVVPMRRCKESRCCKYPRG